MINKDIVKSIFNNYSIDKVIFIEEKTFECFVICSMKENISYDRWCNLENVLKEYRNKDISLLPLEQAINSLGKDYLSKGVVIQ